MYGPIYARGYTFFPRASRQRECWTASLDVIGGDCQLTQHPCFGIFPSEAQALHWAAEDAQGVADLLRLTGGLNFDDD